MADLECTPVKNATEPALVVGFSIHGLAVARALARCGVPVHCLSDISASDHATAYTRYAKVHFRSDLNHGPLTRYLLEIATEIGGTEKIVLFPTSDRMVKAIALNWEALRGHFLLSWADCRELIITLQRKDTLAKYCEKAGILHPRSVNIQDAAQCAIAAGTLRFPIVIKPAQPLSSFKAIVVENATELRHYVDCYSNDLPFVAQEWIEGTGPSLYSCTTFAVRGMPLFMITSRKLASAPPETGQGTVFETIRDDRTRAITERFLLHTNLTGPVAVEFKEDSEGRLWFIEPNVGRTEYCVDLTIQSGFNLPYAEYLYVTGRIDDFSPPMHLRECVWFDTDKDPLAFLQHLAALWRAEAGRRTPIFPYLGHSDLRPVVRSTILRASQISRGALRRLRLRRPR